MSTQALIPSVSIAHCLATRDGIRDRFEQVKRLLQEADTMAKSAGFGEAVEGLVGGRPFRLTCQCSVRPWLTDGSVADHIKHVDVHGWEHLLSQTGLRTFMDATARDDWEKQLREGTAPPLTRDMIAGVFATLNDDRQSMLERGVIKVFRALSWDHKTNHPQMFGKKIIVKGLLNHNGWVDTRTANLLADLSRAMAIFDGQPEPDHRLRYWQTIKIKDGVGVYETDYLSVKVHKNGNGHIAFKRMDLVEKLNGIVAKHYPNALPAPK